MKTAFHAFYHLQTCPCLVVVSSGHPEGRFSENPPSHPDCLQPETQS